MLCSRLVGPVHLARSSCSCFCIIMVRKSATRHLSVIASLHTSHVTRHTSHVTRHTSHVTRHTSHVTNRTAHVTRHTSHVTLHTSHVTHHTWLPQVAGQKRVYRIRLLQSLLQPLLRPAHVPLQYHSPYCSTPCMRLSEHVLRRWRGSDRYKPADVRLANILPRTLNHQPNT